jgi:UDP-N-acetylmuramoyl-L-alanyl-D-glutamate--2,6-diaminopimelate ligase
MTLRDLMGREAPEVEISALAYSSDSVTPGALFFCVPGFRSDGHDFAPDAVERGAAALVTQRRLDLGVPELVVDDVRAAMGPAAARFYGDPTAELDVVGVTGTNGKTTTAYLVRHLLEAAGRRTGLLGTVKRVVGGVEEEVERTTPEAIDLQATFRRMADAATAPSRWRCPRTRSSSGARPESASPARCSRTSRRTTSTSTARWTPTTPPSGACSTSPAPRS